MTDIALPPSRPSLTRGHVNPAEVLVRVSNPAPEIGRLAAGSVLHGVVTGHDPQGRALVRTDQGILVLGANLGLAVGSQVTLEVRSAGSQLLIALMRVDGRPATAPGPGLPSPGLPGPAPGRGGAPGRPGPQGAPGPGAVQAQAPAQGPAQGQPQTTASRAQDSLTLGQTLGAVVRAPPAGGAAPDQSPAVPRLPPGTELRLRVLRVEAPPPPGSGTQTRPAGGTLVQANLRPTAPPAASLTASPPAGSLSPSSYPPPTASISSPASATPASATPAPATPAPAIPAPALPASATPAPATPAPAIPAPATPGPMTPGPITPGSVTPSPVTPGPATPAPATPTLATSAPGTPAPGTPAPATPATAASPPAGPAPAVTAALTLSGVVTGVAAGGGNLLETPVGTLVLDLKAPLPAGSRLQFELPIPPAHAASTAPGPATLVHGWPALEDSLRVLAELGGQADSPSLRHVPQPGPRLASGILFFLNAIGAGDLAGWLGKKTIEVLNANARGGLTRQLGQDFAQLGRLSDAAGSDWRFVPIPLYDGQQVQQIRLFLRHRRDQGDAPDGSDEATRFIVEVELIRLGDMQLDGLVRQHRFDLILRTRRALPGTMRNDIKVIFHDANEIAGHRGGIAFQASGDWEFLPLDAKAAAPDLVI